MSWFAVNLFISVITFLHPVAQYCFIVKDCTRSQKRKLNLFNYTFIYPMIAIWVIYGSVIYYFYKKDPKICKNKEDSSKLIVFLFIILIIWYVNLVLLIISYVC